MKYLSQPGLILSSRVRSKLRRCEYKTSFEPYDDMSMCRLHILITGAKALTIVDGSFFTSRAFGVVNARCDSSGDGGGGKVNGDAVVPFGICNVWPDAEGGCVLELPAVRSASPNISRSSSRTNSSRDIASPPSVAHLSYRSRRHCNQLYSRHSTE